MPRIFSLLMAEALAILWGLKVALEGGFTKILIQFDCEVLVMPVKTKKAPLTDVSLFVLDILLLTERFYFCDIMFMPIA